MPVDGGSTVPGQAPGTSTSSRHSTTDPEPCLVGSKARPWPWGHFSLGRTTLLKADLDPPRPGRDVWLRDSGKREDTRDPSGRMEPLPVQKNQTATERAWSQDQQQLRHPDHVSNTVGGEGGPGGGGCPDLPDQNRHSNPNPWEIPTHPSLRHTPAIYQPGNLRSEGGGTQPRPWGHGSHGLCIPRSPAAWPPGPPGAPGCCR